MASLLGFLGALGDQLGIGGDTQQPGALTRFNNSVDPVAADQRAQAQAEQSALVALANNRQQGITNPQTNINTLAQYVPAYTQVAAQTQAQNPLSALITGANNPPSAPYNPAASGPKDPNASASLPWSTQNTGGQGASSLADLSGADLLKALPPAIANQIKATAEGRQSPPSGYAMKSPYGQQFMALLAQYDPSFDIANPAKRVQAANSFAPGGKDRQNINSIETAINTLSQLNDASEKLGGVDNLGPLTGPANAIRTGYLSSSNDKNLKTYETLAKTAADEVTKAVVGGQGGGVGDRAKREEAFTSGQSPTSRAAAIQAAISELSARLDPVAASYTEAMGKPVSKGISLMTPKAQLAYAKIMGVSPDATDAASTQAQPGAQPAAANDPVARAKAAGYSDAEIQAYIKKKGSK